MSTPVLHLLAGPNGSGKSTFVARYLQPRTQLPFVNADELAAEHWPGDEEAHAYDASRLAATIRAEHVTARRSFIAETVFSHPSKVDLVRAAVAAGYVVTLHGVLVPLETTVARVAGRVLRGGHAVPEPKIRERYERLWPLVADARSVASRTFIYDNSRAAAPFFPVAAYERGRLVGATAWPSWTPAVLLDQAPPADRSGIEKPGGSGRG